MKRALAIVIAGWLGAGCSLFWAPDRNQIIPDDAGPDASRDGGPDGGDVEIDGGCPGGQTLETECTLGEDDDCDGMIDCFDFDCRGVATCCTGATPDDVCVNSADWAALPVGTSDIQFGGCTSTTRFSTHNGPARALVSNQCQPLHFGMRFVLDFRIEVICGDATGCDWAALTFVNRQVLADGSELDDEFRIVVFANGSARVERSGTTLESLPMRTLAASMPISLVLDVQPGPDPQGNDVLFADISLEQGTMTHELMLHEQLMPIDDVHCFGGPSPEIGLFAALEGAGTDVDIASDVEITERSCANPSQFRTDGDASTDALDDCSPLNAGAPAIASYCYANCDNVAGTPQFQWDAWVDGSADPRELDDLSVIDFGICGYLASSAIFPDAVTELWSGRGRALNQYQWLMPPSAREPTILPLLDLRNAAAPISALRFAYAARMSTDDEHAIYVSDVTRTAAAGPAPTPTLLPSEVGCRSLRDPLLVADWRTPDESEPVTQGAWLLFTCEPEDADATKSIMAVYLQLPDYTWDRGEVLTVLSATEGMASYAFRGVRAPEGFTEVSGGQLTLRLWYIARNNTGTPQLAYAQGRGPLGEGLPTVEPFPANPILVGDDPVLGGDCSIPGACSITGASVATIANNADNYQFVIARSRRTATTGEEHDLIPLLQPRPND